MYDTYFYLLTIIAKYPHPRYATGQLQHASFPIFRFPFFLLHFGFPFFRFPFFRFPFIRFPSILDPFLLVPAIKGCIY